MTNYEIDGEAEEQVSAGEVEANNSEETTPSEEQNLANSDTPEMNGSETAKNGQTKVDKNGLTHEQKMQYSFRKQLAKNKQKYENNYSQLQEQYNQLLARLDKLEHPVQPLSREQFATDDEYIQKLVEDRFNSVWESRLKEANDRYQKELSQNKEIEAYRSRQDENVKRLFKTPEAEQQYKKTVGEAIANGLGELVDSDKELSSYIMRSDMGPKILFELATKPEEVERLFADNVTEMDRQFLIREMENRLRNEINKPAVPVIGKPGLTNTTKVGGIFDSDDSILSYLRTH